MKQKLSLLFILSFSFFIQANSQDVLQKMFKAVFNGKIEVISLYLTIGFDVDATDNHGNTLLHTAVTVEDSPIVRLLLAYQADPHKPNQFGATPLSLSAELENTQIFNILAQGAGQNSDSKNNSNHHKQELPSMQDIWEEKKLEQALRQAVQKGTPQKIAALLSIGADKYINNIYKIQPSDTAKTLLLTAILRRHQADKNKESILITSEGREYEEQEAESEAIKKIKEADEIIDILLKYANVNLKAEEQNHLTLPINLAIYCNLPDTVEKLIQAGAHISYPHLSSSSSIITRNNPLYLAIDAGYFEIIDILLRYKAPFPKELNDLLKERGPYYRKILLFVYQHVGNPDNVKTPSEGQNRPDKNSPHFSCRRSFSPS